MTWRTHICQSNLTRRRHSLALVVNKMQANGQSQQAGQSQLTLPHLSYNTNGSNQGYKNNTSYNGLVGHRTMHNVRMQLQSIQKQNNFLTLNNVLPTSSHLGYYPNSTQNASNQNTATVNLNHQVMLGQKTSVSGNSQSAVLNGNLPYYHSLFKLPTTLKQRNKCVNSRTENASVPMTNPSTSSTMQRMCYTQQPAVQSHMSSQTSQQAACAPQSFYTPNVNVAFLNVPNAQIYTVSPVTLTPVTLSTSRINGVVANNPTVQNKYIVSQTNDNRSVHSVNGCTPLANSQSNSRTAVPFQTQQTSVKGYINMQTPQPILLAANDNNTSSAPLPSPTCLQKNVTAVPLQTNMSTNNHSFNPSGNCLFYHKMNNVSNNLSLCTPLNQASEISRSEGLAKIDAVSSAQAKDCALQISPGRGTRAVAVVLPLSQESSPNKHPSPSSQSCSKPASGSCFFSSNQLEKAPVQTPILNQTLEQKLHQSTSSSNISIEKANTQALSPSQRLGLQDAGTKLSSLLLTFAQLVEGNYSAKVSERQKSNSPKETPKEQKTCEEALSSVPTAEWTLKMLHTKIVEMENKENEQKTETNDGKYDGVRQIIYTFWNGDCKAMINDAKNGSLSNEMSDIRKFCDKIDIDTVILSQNQSSHPSRYHVLLHNEVYEEKSTYTSSWLNINQLDDIDKEFGLPYFLKYGKNCSKSVDAEPKSNSGASCQPEIKFAIPKPEELKNEGYPSNTLSNPICSIPLVTSSSTNSEKEKHNTFAYSDPDTEKEAQSNDSSYSFKIEVLPPEEAKVIFKQIECDRLQVEDTAVSEEVLPSDRDDAVNQTCHVTSLEKICCVEKWKEKVYGLSTESKCKCEEQNQNEDKLEQLENKNSWLLGTVDLIEDDDICIFTQESENIQEDKTANKSTITVSSEGEDESLVSEKDYATQADQHGEHDQDLVISTESQKDIGTNKNILENSNVKSEMTMSDKSLDQVQDCRKASSAEMTQTANPVSSQPVSASDVKENEKRLSSENLDPLLHLFKKPKLSSHLKSQTILESFSKCRNGKPSQTVELALFGSDNKTCASGSSQQTQMRSSLTHTRLLFDKTEEAPKRLYVKFSPFPKSDKQEAEPSGNISVKERIHEKWRNSLPLATIRLKRKNKRFAIVSASQGRTIHLSPAKHKDKCAASKRKPQDSDDGQCLKKMSRSNGQTLNTLKKPVVEVRPLPEKFLKFNVLPNTFNLQGSNGTDSTTDSKAEEKAVPVPSGGNSLLKTKVAWHDESTSKSPPQSPSSVPESTGLFQEFQRRYKMRQASTDE